MKDYTLKLNKNELRALKLLLENSIKCCGSCCAYPEMQNNKKGCDNCLFEKAVESIEEKVEEL